MSIGPQALPPDDRKRNLTLAQPDSSRNSAAHRPGRRYQTHYPSEPQQRRSFRELHAHPARWRPAAASPRLRGKLLSLLEGEMAATFRGQRLDRACWRDAAHSRPKRAPHQFHNASAAPVRPTVRLGLAGRPRAVLHGSWRAGRHSHHAPTEAGRKRTGRIIIARKPLRSARPPKYRTELLREA